MYKSYNRYSDELVRTRMWIAVQALQFQQHDQICVESYRTQTRNVVNITALVDAGPIDPFRHQDLFGREFGQHGGGTHSVQIATAHFFGKACGTGGFPSIIEFRYKSSTPFIGQSLQISPRAS